MKYLLQFFFLLPSWSLSKSDSFFN
jgi:hypothetical protein